ncbi:MULTISPECIES: diacylglycerol kinase family protein [unclassified Spirosoma]|uniref:diacylglycerol/lipid kinase family protein n=1 Tax=unclassified Spirosoma TaxID=2621999 RepID=UPI0009639534|nr:MULTISPECIES: diacylglycerol kinase family protein [unclassified Spirosoma]MBN8826924.1 diacylglycerol kinase [Spirosoma sp.]OJW74701.1 MAG: diacylglycerol kinase [Spirosoma sp. 48-14]
MAIRSKVLAIINPNSGTTSADQKKVLLDAFVRRAEALDYDPEVLLTTHAGHATELATDAVKRGVSRVLTIGGDGTINEIAQALRRTSTSLGIVPIGSGNGLARHLGVPLNPLKAIDRALSGRPVVIDSGEINEYPFFCTAGMGFEAYVAHEFAKAPVRGLPTYIRTAFRAFWAYKPQQYRIDGQAKALFSMTFANAGQFGNNAWMAPTANIADGRLEQCEIRPFPTQAAGMLTWRLFNKTLNQSSYWRGRSITKAVVETDGPLLIHADGEPLTLPTGRAEVRILPGSLLVLL